MVTATRTAAERLASAIAEILGDKSLGFKHDATGVPTAVYGHGPGGVFTYPGVDPQVFSTIIGVEAGMIGKLPKYPSVYTNPIYETVTGVQADIGAEATALCGPAPTAGLLKACKLTSVFGRYRRQTRELYLNRQGQRTDYSDPTNLQLMNALAVNDPFLKPDGIPDSGSGVLNLEIAKILFEFGASVNRLIARQLWIGNPANNNATGAYKELTGFDLLIATGKVDAETGAACPSLDPDIKEFGCLNVDGSDGGDIVNVLTYLYRYVSSIARKTGLMPVDWVFAMREELFYELSAVWPCSYLTYRCRVRGVQDQQVVMANEQIRMRDEMRRGQYLLIDGIQIPVVLDDGILEDTPTNNNCLVPGQFASDIYLIPLTVLGGTPVTYMEYFNHDNPDIQATIGGGRMDGQVWTTNNGAWIWTAERSRLCYFYEGKLEPRLVIRTPQLAGRVQNVKYVPLQHTREPFPSDPYFVDGGVTYRPGPSLWSEWNHRQ